LDSFQTFAVRCADNFYTDFAAFCPDKVSGRLLEDDKKHRIKSASQFSRFFSDIALPSQTGVATGKTKKLYFRVSKF
jgi:hypothetical protein